MFCTITTTTNDKAVAKSLCEYILEQKISPCVQIYNNVKSSFIWKNKVNNEYEYKIEIKTIESNENEVIKAIERFHNYDIPEIVKMPLIIKSNNYKKWFLTSVNIKGD